MKRPGTYILVITFEEPRSIRVGALGEHHFRKGTYIYAGSAMGGLDQRLNRHFSKHKTIHWHIDNLTVACDSIRAYESYPDYVPECDLARTVEECGGVPEMDGFGCSDCHCGTHLFRASDGVVERVVDVSALAPFNPTQLL